MLADHANSNIAQRRTSNLQRVTPSLALAEALPTIQATLFPDGSLLCGDEIAAGVQQLCGRLVSRGAPDVAMQVRFADQVAALLVVSVHDCARVRRP